MESKNLYFGPLTLLKILCMTKKKIRIQEVHGIHVFFKILNVNQCNPYFEEVSQDNKYSWISISRIPYLSELAQGRLFNYQLFEGGAYSKEALIRGKRLLKTEINQYVMCCVTYI